jgi:hypothetical protein
MMQDEDPGAGSTGANGHDDKLSSPAQANKSLATGQATFVVRLRATRGDGIKGLRAVLKFALRAHGLRCISVEEMQS